jgi:iron complex outermembrane receptor protein
MRSTASPISMPRSTRARRSAAPRWSANWNLGPATLTSVTAWRYWDWQPERPRLHRPADHHGLAEPVAAEAMVAGTAPRLERRWPGSTTRSAPSSSTRRSTPRARRSRDGGEPLAALGRRRAQSERAQRPDLDQHDQLRQHQLRAVRQAQLGSRWTGFHIQPGLRVNYDKKSGYYDSVVSIHNAQYNFDATADNVAACSPTPPRSAPRGRRS